jgi:formylglycine-generating enzyme required for sulfatase activity
MLSVRSFFAALASLTFLVPTLAPSVAQGQGFPFEPISGTEMVDTGTYGVLPREVIWKTDGREMVLIPQGTYTIGRPTGTRDEVPPSESPQATVTLGWYYIDRYEVDQKTYGEFAAVRGARRPSVTVNQDMIGPDLPAIGITYMDSLGYARHHGKDLPTEAEWEVAGRGPDSNLYPWGSNPEEGAARVALGPMAGARSGGSSPRDKSPFGVYDLGGNVSEWTKDYYHRGYYSLVDGQENPSVETVSDSRTIRGGNVTDRAADGRLTQRVPGLMTTTLEHVGFRTVFRLMPPPPPTPTPEPTPTPVPRTSLQEQEAKALEVLGPYIRDPRQQIPMSYLVAARDRTAVQYINQTPDRIVVAAIDLNAARLATEPVIIEGGSTAPVSLVNEQVYYHYIYSMSRPELGVIPIGAVNNASKPLVLITTDLFYPLVNAEGKVIAPKTDNIEAMQYYPGEYAPQWNMFEIHNSTPNVIRITAASADARVTEEPQTRILDPGQMTRMQGFTGIQAEIRVEYVGGSSPALDPSFRFLNNNAADHRIFIVQEDTGDSRRVSILTRQVPMVRIRPIEVRLPDALRGAYLPSSESRGRTRR